MEQIYEIQFKVSIYISASLSGSGSAFWVVGLVQWLIYSRLFRLFRWFSGRIYWFIVAEGSVKCISAVKMVLLHFSERFLTIQVPIEAIDSKCCSRLNS